MSLRKQGAGIQKAVAHGLGKFAFVKSSRRGISLTDAHPITTEPEYDAALARVSELMNALNGPHGQIEDPNHPARVELDALVDLIEMYENEHYPIEQRDAVAAS